MSKEEEIQLHKEWTRQLIEVMQAYIDGKEIEERCGLGNWHDCPIPIWDWIGNDYRIKGEE